MADPKNTQGDSDMPSTPAVTFVNPRRATAEDSITLRHHRLARDASKRHTPSAIPDAHSRPAGTRVHIPRRNSSEESNETRLSGSNKTGLSDPKQWFDRSNQHATWTLDSGDMDIDPPFFQKETDSSNEEIHHVGPSQSGASYRRPASRGASYRPSFAKSSSADEYRSVIDDLTIENKRLKEELRRFKQMGPSSLRNEKLFEVKVHGLPSRKKRELEATLRDFTSNLERSSTSASTNRKKASGKSKEGASSISKHTSSASGSGSRPVDSAYASMSVGQSSSSNARPDQGRAARLRSNQNVEDYLRDIPEGLWPRPVRLTEADKKKLVVRRLEHLFTGKMFHSGHPKSTNVRQPTGDDVEMADAAPKAPLVKEGAREAMIRDKTHRQRGHNSHTAASASHTQNPHTHSHSNSHSNADQSNYHDYDKDSGTGSGSGSRSAQDGKNSSPQDELQATEQRPTRLGDLDPDRQQVPADNIEYIRHLGLVAPESRPHFSARDVSPDGEGWVYLNLLGNLAQLHILNVTPDFIRSAVSERSTKFQLSPDGRKIRWRGGDEGTRFTSDSCTRSETEGSGDEDSNGGEQPSKRRKQKGSKFGLGAQQSSASEKFHYKPIFARRHSTFPDEDTVDGDASVSSNLQSEPSNPGAHSRWDQSGVSTGLSQRKRRRDGAIIYYSGAPFCTDLSGDSGEVSPDTYDMSPSSGDHLMADSPIYPHLTHRPLLSRSASGSSIPSKPLSDPNPFASLTETNSSGEGDLIPDEGDEDIKADFAWSDSDQQSFLTHLEASGLGGVYPSDHFVVVVSTKRPKTAGVRGGVVDDNRNESSMTDEERPQTAPRKEVDRHSYSIVDSQELVDSIIKKLAQISTESPAPRCVPSCREITVEIRYVDGKIHRLPPVPLPPPTFFVPSGDSNSDGYDDSLEDAISVSSERSILSKRPMLECTPDSDNRDLSGNDEEDEHSDDSPDFDPNANASDMSGMPGIEQEHKFPVPHLLKDAAGSSAATAGGATGSICYSSLEET